MPIFLILVVITLVTLSIPYVVLYWWIQPTTVLGIFGVLGLGSLILFGLFVMVGMIQNYRANR